MQRCTPTFAGVYVDAAVPILKAVASGVRRIVSVGTVFDRESRLVMVIVYGGVDWTSPVVENYDERLL